MKLFINATHFYDTPSGLGVYTQNLVRALLKRYSNVKVFTGNRNIEVSDLNSLVITPRCINPRKGTFGHLLRLLWEHSFLWINTIKERPDILFSTVHEGIALPIIKTKQIITIHDLIALRFPHYFKRLKYYFTYFLPATLENSHAIVCVSESTKKDLLTYYKPDKPVYVVYPGYDKRIFFPRRREKFKSFGRYILFVGDMRPHKNLERLIQAISKLRHLNFKLLIAGKKDKRFYPALEKIVKDHRIEDRIVFLDYVPLEELPHIYSCAEAFVFPSLYEGFGLPLIEAMACGCPVVTSDIPPIREVCGDSVYYVNPYDTESIAGAIYRILTDPSLRENFRVRGIDRTKAFSWEKSADEHVKIFEEVMKGNFQRKL